MAVVLYVAICANVPAVRAAIYGSAEEIAHVGPTAVAPQPPLPIAGGYWGPMYRSGNAVPLFACAVWASMLAGTATAAALQALAVASTIKMFIWDDATEDLATFYARWRAGAGWIDKPDPT